MPQRVLCDTCETKTAHEKIFSLELALPPTVLFIQLKRFVFVGWQERGRSRKINTAVNVPLELRLPCPDDGEVRYILHGTIDHHGESPHSGHYTYRRCASQVGFGKHFVTHDDACLSDEPLHQGTTVLSSETAYLLIYRLRPPSVGILNPSRCHSYMISVFQLLASIPNYFLEFLATISRNSIWPGAIGTFLREVRDVVSVDEC